MSNETCLLILKHHCKFSTYLKWEDIMALVENLIPKILIQVIGQNFIIKEYKFSLSKSIITQTSYFTPN
jgi:hypothetical protein